MKNLNNCGLMNHSVIIRISTAQRNNKCEYKCIIDLYESDIVINTFSIVVCPCVTG